MDKFVTVKYFGDSYQAEIVKGHLESEGIACILSGEIITRVVPYPTSLGGIKLEVKENDYLKAVEILKNTGYLIDDDSNSPNYSGEIDSFTSHIPLIGLLNIGNRLIALSIVIIIATSIIYYYETLPTQPPLKQALTQDFWYVNKVIYNGRLFSSDSLVPAINGNWGLHMTFYKNGDLNLPSVNSLLIQGHWELNDKHLTISQADTFQTVYDGNYDIKITGNNFTLKSKTTVINGHMESN